MLCPCCGSSQSRKISASYSQCASCELIFSGLEDPTDVFIDFSTVGGWLTASATIDEIRSSLTPVEAFIASRLVDEGNKTSAIVEFYSEVPRLLTFLRKMGFSRVVGFDPVEGHQDLLCENGIAKLDYRDQVFELFEQNENITFIFVESIVRLNEGIEFIKKLKMRFPNCRVLFSTPHENRSIFFSNNSCNYIAPPNIRTIWPLRALETLVKGSETTEIKDVNINFRASSAGFLVKTVAFNFYRFIGHHKYSRVIDWLE